MEGCHTLQLMQTRSIQQAIFKNVVCQGREVTHVLSVPLILNDDGSLHVLAQGLLCERVHLLPSFQGLLPQGHLPLLCHLSFLLGICRRANPDGCEFKSVSFSLVPYLEQLGTLDLMVKCAQTCQVC